MRITLGQWIDLKKKLDREVISDNRQAPGYKLRVRTWRLSDGSTVIERFGHGADATFDHQPAPTAPSPTEQFNV